jgi:hypothetical protein
MTVYINENERSVSDFNVYPQPLPWQIAQCLFHLLRLGLGQLFRGVATPLAAALLVAQQLLGFLRVAFVQA